MEDGEIEEGSVHAVDEDDQGFEHSSEHRNPDASPFEMLHNSKTSIEKIVAEILLIKKNPKPKQLLREFVTQMFLHFVTLRQANRSILVEEDRVKTETERAKAPVDLTTLQLHNLMYEKSHYVKAIKACKDFKSKYPDIELVPEQEFFRDAPKDIKESVLSKDAAHNLMLQRLNFELFQRKELCKLHEKLEQKKKSLLEIIANRKKFLTSLPSHLKSLKKASLPVQNQLGVLHSKKLKQHHSAELLPPSLYVIHSQLLAHMEAFGEPIDVEIIGSLKDAQAFAHQQAHNKEAGISSAVESSKLEDDALDEDEDGQRRRKRRRRVQGKDGLDQAGTFQAHPLKITIHVYDDEASEPKSAKLVTMKFEYLVKLNVVCVGIEGSVDGPENDILCNLFPNDTGLELPHQSAKVLVGDPATFNSQRKSSRPYKWAQHLAGIDFLPEVSHSLHTHHESTYNSGAAKNEDVVSGLSIYRQQNRVQTVLQRIRSRRKAQLALLEQLESLTKLEWPLLSSKSVPWALHKPLCNLDVWSPVRALPVPSEASPPAVIDKEEHVQDPMDVDAFDSSGATKQELESITEDGELPTLLPNMSKLDHSKQLTLISKSVTPSPNKVRSLSFKKLYDTSDILLDIESDLDEPVQIDEHDNIESSHSGQMSVSWMDYGVKEFSLVFSRKISADESKVNLEAKIKISMEYPLRSPQFGLNLRCMSSGKNRNESDGLEWFNELRAMEAEVNLHMLKMLPIDQQNYVLAHQVCCLAMLFDYYLEEASPSSERTNCTSVVDVGLCKPVSGRFLARSLRGRDRRKLISWTDMQFTSRRP